MLLVLSYARYVVLLVVVLSLSACATYYQRNLAFQDAFTTGEMDEALKQLENKKAKKDKVKVLYYLNKGVVAQMMGNPEASKQALMSLLKQNHPYDVPEIICIKIDDVDSDYAEWLNAQINSRSCLLFLLGKANKAGKLMRVLNS